MRPRSLLRATAFRVALANALVFGVVVLVFSTALFAISRERVLAQMDSDIHGDWQSLRATYEDEGAAGLIRTVDRLAEAAGNGQAFYLLRGRQGNKLAGNIPLVPIQHGWAWIHVRHGLPVELDNGLMRTLGRTLPNGQRLLIGRNPRHLNDLENVFITGLLWTELGVLLFGLASGYLVSRRMLRGVQTIADEVGHIGAGALSRRIPPIGGSDEIGRIGAAVNLMLDRIGVLTDSLRQVTNDIAHDLRTPLARLRQNLERATLQARSAEDLRAAAERALQETDAIIATFNALLRIAQVEGQERRSGFATLDLSELVLRLADAYGPSAEDAGHRMDVAVAPGVRVFGDADLLGQMLANLIENALRHTPAGSRIALRLEPRPSGPRLVVADTGPGIPAEKRAHVLGRFVRLDASRGTPGTGLGLALAKAVANLHGITLTLADNAPGLRVILDFPQPSP
ncbi:MAG TPA: HAMP domain-containing sensor histidine kinase [Acetobacteraceae bacterium]|nr:HAMP domain-containing sensor histidine kinase [Acetobacteraceae bacterium]